MRRLVPIFLSLYAGMVCAQINAPLVSPPSIVSQRVGFTEITINYSRPSMRGRKIMGDLIPYGRIWRVGANESTKITFSENVRIDGHEVPRGTYALLAYPSAEEWIIVIHKNISHWGDGRDQYNPGEDLLRFVVKPERIPYTQETFLIEFDKLSHKSGRMVWLWENTKISFLIEVNTDNQMMAQIQKAIVENPTADTFYQSARYLQEEGKMQKQAIEWLEQAQKLAGDKYYIHRVWGLVLAQLKDYPSAITHAEKSKELAAHENKDEFVRMNEASIVEWTKLMSSN